MGKYEKKANKWAKETYAKLKSYTKGRMSMGDATDNSPIKNPDQAIPTVGQVAKHTKNKYKKASNINKKGY